MGKRRKMGATTLDRRPFTASEKGIIEGIRRTASENLPKGTIVVLFGSRARGDARVDSDWDLLVLTDKDRDQMSIEEKDNAIYSFSLLGYNTGNEINPVVYSKSEWMGYSYSSFFKNVQKEGIRLW